MSRTALAVACALLATASALLADGCGGAGAGLPPASATAAVNSTRSAPPPASGTATSTAARNRDETPYAVGEQVLKLVDHSRTVVYPGGVRRSRTLVTVVRYPALGPSSRVDARGAPPDRAAGPFPLVVFGHGFAVTPATYFRLLRAWAQAGYVVAAPVFPLENAHAPGGPVESDIVNQPRDMRFVITRMLAASAGPNGPLTGLIARRAIAVAGHSDGAETALFAAYIPSFRDSRVRAAVILSGAAPPGRAIRFAPHSPALLAVQGNADTTNRPFHSDALFAAARSPKFLLRLIGAGHLAPYTDQQPQLTIVQRTTLAFLDRYLEGSRSAAARLTNVANRPGISTLIARP